MGKMETVKFRVWNGREMVYDIMAGKFGIFYVNPEKGDGLNTEDKPFTGIFYFERFKINT